MLGSGVMLILGFRVCRFESLIISHHSRFTCEYNKKQTNDDDDDGRGVDRGLAAEEEGDDA